MRRIYLLLGVSFLTALVVSCSSQPEPAQESVIEFSVTGEDTILPVKGTEVLNIFSCVADSLKPGNHFSRIDSVSQYGLGLAYTLPDSLIGKKIEIKIKAKILGTKSQSCLLVTSLESVAGKQSLYYGVIDAGMQMMGKTGQWIDVSGDLIIDADKNNENSAVLKIYPWMNSGKGETCIDDITVTMKVYGESEEE